MKYFLLLFMKTFIISCILLLNSAFAAENSIIILNNPALKQATQNLEIQGKITQDSHNRVYLKLFGDYSTKLYPHLLNGLNPMERKCLQPVPNETHQLYLYQANEPQMFTQQIHNFRVTKVYKVVQVKKHRDQNYFETWYFLNIASQDLNKLIPPNHHKYLSSKLFIKLAVSRKSIKTGRCLGYFAQPNEL